MIELRKSGLKSLSLGLNIIIITRIIIITTISTFTFMVNFVMSNLDMLVARRRSRLYCFCLCLKMSKFRIDISYLFCQNNTFQHRCTTATAQPKMLTTF